MGLLFVVHPASAHKAEKPAEAGNSFRLIINCRNAFLASLLGMPCVLYVFFAYF